MKAFCYRSGHVMTGISVPPGAEELADHDNEAELLWVIAYHTRQFRDAEGCPQTVLPCIMLAKDGIDVDLAYTEVAEAFEDDLAKIKKNPRYMTVLVPGPITPWRAVSGTPGKATA